MLCPINECDKTVSNDKVMCGRHWATVPRDLQRAVYRAWGALLKRAGHPDWKDAAAEHHRVKDEAIAAAQAADDMRRLGAAGRALTPDQMQAAVDKVAGTAHTAPMDTGTLR